MNNARPASSSQQVFLREESWLYGMAKRLVRDDASARDVVQDVYLAMMTNPPRDTTTPRAWLGTVARRIVLGGRSRMTIPLEAADHEVDPNARPEEHVAQSELTDLILGAASDLDEDLQRTVWLRFKEGLRHADIARQLGIDERTVRARLTRAYEKMRVNLAPHVQTELHGSWWAWLPALIHWAWPRRSDGKSAPAAAAGKLPILAVIIPAVLIATVAVSVLAGEDEAGSAMAQDGSTEDQDTSLSVNDQQQPQAGSRTPASGERPDDVQPGETPQASPDKAASASTYRLLGTVKLTGLGVIELEAAMLREGWFSDLKTADTGKTIVSPEGEFEVSVIQPGQWRLLVRPRTGSWGFAFYSVHDLGNAHSKITVDLEATLLPFTVMAPGRDGATLNVTWLDASGWHFEAAAQVKDGAAFFEALPAGQVRVHLAPKGRPKAGEHGEFLAEAPVYENGENTFRLPR